MNIVLIGPRCSGKTEVGKILAAELEKGFVDTDEMIERVAGCPIERMVTEKGWAHFRQLEKDVIKEVSTRDNLIVATGGGVVMDQSNVENLRTNGWIVWLRGETEALVERMLKEQESGKVRPSLTGANSLDEMKEILEMREPLYEKASDMEVDTTMLKPGEVAASIALARKESKKG